MCLESIGKPKQLSGELSDITELRMRVTPFPTVTNPPRSIVNGESGGSGNDGLLAIVEKEILIILLFNLKELSPPLILAHVPLTKSNSLFWFTRVQDNLSLNKYSPKME